MDTKKTNNAISFLVFVVFIISPFIAFSGLMFFISDDDIFGMFMRLINSAALIAEILIVFVLNISGFCILKKDRIWKRCSFVYLLIQAVVSIIIAVYFVSDSREIVGESILVNDIVLSESYLGHSMIIMCIFNALSFLIAVCILGVGHLAKKSEHKETNNGGYDF
ncbi:MAG: hypothetical protein IJ446_01070 [Oscillospiraceae bacterium]|nr:hypothetical protein [Oscillospiraceae bacterium]